MPLLGVGARGMGMVMAAVEVRAGRIGLAKIVEWLPEHSVAVVWLLPELIAVIEQHEHYTRVELARDRPAVSFLVTNSADEILSAIDAVNLQGRLNRMQQSQGRQG